MRPLYVDNIKRNNEDKPLRERSFDSEWMKESELFTYYEWRLVEWWQKQDNIPYLEALELCVVFGDSITNDIGHELINLSSEKMKIIAIKLLAFSLCYEDETGEELPGDLLDMILFFTIDGGFSDDFEYLSE